MVHLVKKKVGNNYYLYLQKSLHLKGTRQKKRTEHVAYLGRADKYSSQQLTEILKVAQKSTKKEIIKLIRGFNVLKN